MEKFKVLIVDDDRVLLEAVSDVLELKGYSTTKVDNGEKAVELLAKGPEYNLALVDLKLPGMNGLEVLKAIKEKFNQLAVIIITGHATVESAVNAMKSGASDYLEKPINPEELLLVVEKERKIQQLVNQNIYFVGELSRKYHIENIIGESPAMHEVFEKIRDVADSDTSVLITGESGTGKELIAHHIHYASARNRGPLVKVSCATLSAGVLESELFGHERGAFTGAVSSKRGRFEMANGGSLFLDEVGDIPMSFQVKLLRVLQSMEFEKVGGTKPIKSDFRLISATNHSLREDISNEAFREDLYFRLNVVEIELPPLRKRVGDLPLILNHFIEIYSQTMNKRILKFSNEAIEALQNYHWPGNVREVKNVVERAFVYCKEEVIGIQHLPQHIYAERKGAIDLSRLPTRSLEEIEKELVALCLLESKGNKSQAAKMLEISRGTLHSKMQKYGLNDSE